MTAAAHGGSNCLFNKRFLGLRTGRANSQLLDGIMVDVCCKRCYQSSGYSKCAGAENVICTIWDKDNVKLVEKSVRESDLGLNPQLDGQLLRILLPD